MQVITVTQCPYTLPDLLKLRHTIVAVAALPTSERSFPMLHILVAPGLKGCFARTTTILAITHPYLLYPISANHMLDWAREIRKLTMPVLVLVVQKSWNNRGIGKIIGPQLRRFYANFEGNQVSRLSRFGSK